MSFFKISLIREVIIYLHKMENLNKVISLNQASKISGYHSDYLSALIRKGEIKGRKVGGSWFTTIEDINDYVFKQKIRHKKIALGGFLSPKRTKKILVLTGVVFLAVIFCGIYFYGKSVQVNLEEGRKTLSSEPEIID